MKDGKTQLSYQITLISFTIYSFISLSEGKSPQGVAHSGVSSGKTELSNVPVVKQQAKNSSHAVAQLSLNVRY